MSSRAPSHLRARLPHKLTGVAAALVARWSVLDHLRHVHWVDEVDVSLTLNRGGGGGGGGGGGTADEHDGVADGLGDGGYLRGTAEEHETVRMRFGEKFLSYLEEEGGVCSATWKRLPSTLRYHLAQCPLSSLPRLEEDVRELLLTEFSGDGHRPTQTNLWFAIGRTISG